MVSVCVCTFKRCQLLGELLAALTNQRFAGCSLEVIVVDNDPEGSAAEVVARCALVNPDVRYVRNSENNISLARNLAIAKSRGEWIALIDDDEKPGEGWIELLFNAAEKYKADAVFGPVVPLYPPDTPPWIRTSRLFERKRFPTGSPMPLAETRSGNVLIRKGVVQGVPGPFNPDFGRSGGEDSELFGYLMHQGGKFIWCDEAAVSETLSSERLDWRWILRRRFRNGQVFARQRLRTGRRGPRTGLWTTALLVAKAIALSFLSLGALLPALLLGKSMYMRCLSMAASQAGKLSALSPLIIEGYPRSRWRRLEAPRPSDASNMRGK